MDSSSVDQYFDAQMTTRDRALFELGIKLGTLFHQFSGSPMVNDKETLGKFERGIEASIESQPYVSSVKVTIIPQTELGKKTNPFDYIELSGKNLKAEINLCYKEWEIVGKIKWIPELKYPLMFVSKIVKK